MYGFRSLKSGWHQTGKGTRAWRCPLVLLMVAGFLRLGQAQIHLNVTNYGAIGDAVQFYANTVSNSTLVTATKALPKSAIGDAIEIFRVGTPTYGKNSYGVVTNDNQDLITTITNIVAGTNVYVADTPLRTLIGTFATSGHNNSDNFRKALADAANYSTYSNVTIDVPAGTFLCLAQTNYYSHGSGLFFSSLVLTHGGLTISGSGTNTVLLGQGAWTLHNVVNRNYQTNLCFYRGVLLAISTPVSNDKPITIENLTLDGGVSAGNISVVGTYPNYTDGLGWDVSHDAVCVFGGNGNTFTHQTWSNVIFQHWRGEMVKSTDGSTNGNATFVNCIFRDGNATAINYYASLLVTNCLFDKLFQVAEYYQAYNTNTSYFVDNVCTNIAGNGFAINGGKGNNPQFIIQSNIFYAPRGNVILTTPGDNVSIIGNQIVGLNVVGNITGINIGSLGYQGTFINSNIVIANNTFENVYSAIQLGGNSSTDPNRTENVQIYDNTIQGGTYQLYANWATNVCYYSNTVTAGGAGKIFTGGNGADYIYIDTNNDYWTAIRDITLSGGVTNSISYQNGPKYNVWYAMQPKTVYALSDTDAEKIPAGASIIVGNSAYGYNGGAVPFYLDSTLTKGSLIIKSGQIVTFYWNGVNWSTNAPANLDTNSSGKLMPPSGLHILP